MPEAIEGKGAAFFYGAPKVIVLGIVSI